MLLRRAALWCIALTISSRLATGQELRGTVRDSASRQGISGAVLMLLDSAGAVRGRNITNERGECRVVLSGGVPGPCGSARSGAARLPSEPAEPVCVTALGGGSR